MKIREIEMKTGMDRTNIRFYEREGLISPVREDNGYREFSDEDLETLLRIKLLRSIHVPLDQIRGLMEGKVSLTDLLEEQIHVLEDEKEDVNYAQEICRLMKNEEKSVMHLDAKKYLDQLDEKSADTKTEYFSVKKDKLPQVYSPWRRFFARMMDISIYSLLFDSALVFIFNMITSNRNTLESLMFTAMVTLIMLLVEPLLLMKFGTTPGKAILGLEVRTPEGNKLSYSEGFRRTFGVIRYGLGFELPIYNIIRNYKSFKILDEKETLPWDDEIAYTMKDEKVYRNGFFIGAMIVIIASNVLLINVENLPPNHGELTIAEFVENYQHYEKVLEIGEDDYELNRFGEWISTRNDQDFYVDLTYYEKPLFKFNLSDEKIRGVSFNIDIRNKKEPLASNREEMLLTYFALAGAQKETTIFSQPFHKFSMEKLIYGFTGFSEHQRGVDLEVEISYKGYQDAGDRLLPINYEKVQNYTLSFSADVH
ncbi:MAG TPA: MerR family transcriptional regulator [Proteiniclasticum sp.]|nr:MerR family transcriptional regulator [Proteiniclasticum sp.]